MPRDTTAGTPGASVCNEDRTVFPSYDEGKRTALQVRCCLSDNDRRILNSKMFLLSQHDPDKQTLYDHLSRVIAQILDEKPEDGLMAFQESSRYLRISRLPLTTTLLRPVQQNVREETYVRAQSALLKKHCIPRRHIDVAALPDILRQAMYFEWASFGLPREEFVRISLAMCDITDRWPVLTIHFWGKIFGTKKNYYIVEVEFAEGDYISETSRLEDCVRTRSEQILMDKDNEDSNSETPLPLGHRGSSSGDDSIFKDDNVSESTIHQPPEEDVPYEPFGTGLNRKVYFVTSEPGLPWLQLPHVTPKHIQLARKIHKFLTGDLNALVISNPPFPGLEKNYLRSQIARITAATHVSPIGYYRFQDEAAEGDEEEPAEPDGSDMCVIDPDFEGVSIKDLADPQIHSWVHHEPYILPQGRTTWYNISTQPEHYQSDDEEDDGEEDDKKEESDNDKCQPEVGPPLLSPLSDDEGSSCIPPPAGVYTGIGSRPVWIASVSSKLVPEYAIAVLRSCDWEGAITVGAEKGRVFESYYIGWGLKSQGSDFEPVLQPMPCSEFPTTPEVTEIDDPTAENEAAARAALAEKALEAEFEQTVIDDDGGDYDDDDDREEYVETNRDDNIEME